MAYVDNNKLYNALVGYKKECLEAEKNNKEYPIVPRYIGECLLLIATNLTRRFNFNGYSWRDDMIGDAVLDALTYIHKFNPDAYTNPFGYFTNNMYWAFVRRIQREKKQSAIKGAMVKEMPMEAFNLQGQDLDHEFIDSHNSYLTMYSSFSDDYPRRKKKTVEKIKSPMELLMDGEI